AHLGLVDLLGAALALGDVLAARAGVTCVAHPVGEAAPVERRVRAVALRGHVVGVALGGPGQPLVGRQRPAAGLGPGRVDQLDHPVGGRGRRRAGGRRRRRGRRWRGRHGRGRHDGRRRGRRRGGGGRLRRRGGDRLRRRGRRGGR